MKKYLLSLLMILAILFITCGNEPPEEFYEGTPEDSTEIANLLSQNTDLLVGEDLVDPTYIFVDLANVGFPVSDSFLRDDTILIKVHVDSCATVLRARNDTLDFWFTKDTTCTVYMYDTFDLSSNMQYDAKYTAYYDSAEVDTVTGDTTWRIGTVIEDSTRGNRTLEYTGNGYRHIFFDYDEATGWELKRISYGTYNFPAAGTDLPVIQQVNFTRGDGTQDSVIQTSYDTLYEGHVMNRFRALDSLLTFSVNDTITVAITLGFGTVVDSMVSYYALCEGSNRVELDGGSGALELTGAGIKNLYIEIVVNEAYYYYAPTKDYKAQVWLIPVRIQ